MYLYLAIIIEVVFTYNIFCLSSDLDYSSLVWGDETLTLLCPPAGEEPHLALPELIQKARNICVHVYIISLHVQCNQSLTYSALVQLGCYQHRYERKGLWCSSTVWLLSTRTRMNVMATVHVRLSLKFHVYMYVYMYT
jgi:hypothetical protein